MPCAAIGADQAGAGQAAEREPQTAAGPAAIIVGDSVQTVGSNRAVDREQAVDREVQSAATISICSVERAAARAGAGGTRRKAEKETSRGSRASAAVAPIASAARTER